MSSPIITVENLSKVYTIGHQRGQGDGLRHRLEESFRAPWRWLRDRTSSNGKPLPSALCPLPSATNPPSSLSPRSSSTESFWALKDVSFEVKPGEVVGIIGRNGAGKSTLLKILSRITEPTDGRVTLKGRVASLLEVGTGFHPELTGRENIFLNGAILGMSRVEIKRKFDEIVAFSEVEKFLDTPVKRYSSGMYVRLAFAVAAHLEPEILIIDEVLAVGDAEFQKKCLGKMQDVSAKEGRTILYVSHNLPSVQSLCTRAIFLTSGAITVSGSPYAVIQQYLAGAHLEAQRQWPPSQRPKNSVAEIVSIAIRDQQGTIASHLTTDQPSSIVIDYIVNHADVTVGLTVMLFNERQELILSSINNHEPLWYGRSMPRGSFRSICSIPGQLLNDGHYTVSINLFGMNFTDLHTVDQVVGFSVVDGPGVRGDYFGRYGGAIRPLLNWKTEKQ